MQTIEKNGMKISWSIKADQVHFEVFAPTQGWVAIGFNEKDKLVGNNLIMGNVVNGVCTISDQFIKGFEDHQAVETLGGQNHLSLISGQEDKKGTNIRFAIQSKAKDVFHYDLIKGKEFTLLIAYAQEDNFDHHSTMRTSIKIIL